MNELKITYSKAKYTGSLDISSEMAVAKVEWLLDNKSEWQISIPLMEYIWEFGDEKLIGLTTNFGKITDYIKNEDLISFHPDANINEYKGYKNYLTLKHIQAELTITINIKDFEIVQE